jgi:hypothetical protein
LDFKIFKEFELAFLLKFKKLPNTNPYNVYKQLFIKWAKGFTMVQPWVYPIPQARS